MIMVVKYLISALLLTVAILAYLRIANRFRIIDRPNERSSHDYITIKGGGVIFPLAGLLWFLLFGFEKPWFVLGLLIIAVLSFMDDVMEISYLKRIMIHLTATSLMFLSAYTFGLPWPYIFAAYILTICWINAFNFMDGINGMSAFYSLVTLGTFWYMNQKVSFASNDLILLTAISVVIFSFFNVRKHARTFAGDVGSISLAFILAFLMALLMRKTDMIVYMLFFAVYGIETFITIIFRLDKGENIFQAHRTHLYQYLCNEMKVPHLVVSAFFAITQLIVNIIAITMLDRGVMNRPRFISILVVLSVIYMMIRFWVVKQIALRKKRDGLVDPKS
jgi:UDP-N-acetylmuramyl pentapeptide phosphotransferase/UDP-N-acetylglucosamine-1-phosphate transferase